MATSAPSLDALYDDAGYKYDVDPLRIKAHAIQETGERAKVASADGRSWGFGQFTPETWARVMPGVPLSARGDPATAIEAMGKFIAQNDAANTDANGNTDVRASTAAYNGSGPAADAYAESVRGIHARLVKAGGLKTSRGQAPAANDDDAFGQTLKASPTPAAPDKAAPDKEAADDAFGQTLKAGPAQEATPPGAAAAAERPSPEAVTLPPQSGLFPHPPTIQSVVSDVGNALKSGYGDTNLLMSPALETALKSRGDAGNALAYGLTGADAALRGGGALFHGGQALVSDLLGGGRMGRDIAAIPEAFAGSPHMLPTPTRDLEPTSGQGIPYRANALAPDRAPPATAGQEPGLTAAPSPGMGAPQPQSGGAAASSAAEATMTPAEILANRHVAEQEWLNRTNTPGVADNRVLVDGVNPTLAQREQTVQTAREQKRLSGQSADVSQEERALADEHNLKRQDAYQKPDLAGSTVLLNNAKQVAKDKLDAGLNAAFANKTAADAQPVVAMADKMLSGRSGKRQAIETEVKGVRARLFDADGKLETDPEILYGVREHINDILSKENQRQNPVSGRAQSVLIKMRDELDTVIDPAAPGFTAAIKGYAADMRQPDVMEALQERYNGLHDSQGRMQFSKVHSLMRDVVDARQPGAALSPFQHITDEQMAKLQNLHDDLKRVASAEDLARAKGSDTAQNMWDAAKVAVKGRGAALVGMTPVVGKAVRGAQEFYAPFAEAKAQRNALKRGMEMLHPDPAKYPTRNPLEGP